LGAAGETDLGFGALKEIGQALAGMKEGKAKEYIVIAVLGGRDSGKTALVNRFVRNSWEQTSSTKRFLDIQNGSMNLKGRMIQVVTCEYAGSSEYRLVQKTMFPPTKSVPVRCMLVLDLNRRESTGELTEVVDSLVVPRLRSKSPPESYLLVGSKSDLKRNISPQELASFAGTISTKLGKAVSHIETSAKEGKNVAQAFEMLVSSQK
jgi:small GTP-binding protein